MTPLSTLAHGPQVSYTPTNALAFVRHLCLHLHHHTPMENLRRYFSHTNALLLDAHDQKIWCNMFRTIHTTIWLISMGLWFYHIRCPCDILLLTQLSLCTSTPTSLIAADKRDYITDARFHQGAPRPAGSERQSGLVLQFRNVHLLLTPWLFF